jgi:hypothetical protein
VRTVCIDICPEENSPNALNCTVSNNVADCNDAGFVRYTTKKYLGKYCMPVEDEMPANIKGNYDTLWDYMDFDTITQYVYDIGRAWAIILIGLILAFIFSIILVLGIKTCAGVICWVSIIGSITFLIALGFWFMFTADDDQDQNEAKRKVYMKIYGALCFLAAFIFAVVVFCYIKQIRIAIAIIRTAGEFIQDTKRVIFVPITVFVLILPPLQADLRVFSSIYYSTYQ